MEIHKLTKHGTKVMKNFINTRASFWCSFGKNDPVIRKHKERNFGAISMSLNSYMIFRIL